MTDEVTVAAAQRKHVRLQMIAEFWHYFSRSKGAVIGLAIIVALVLIALFAPWIAPHNPNAQNVAMRLTPPVWEAKGTATYLLGTDAVGRDMLSRLIYGSRYSLLIGLVVVTIALVFGIVLGPAGRLFPRLG